MDDEDFLDAVVADNANTPEPVKVEVVEPVVETPMEKPKVEVEAPAPVLELTELAPEQPKPTEGFVPLGAMMDERDKRKAVEARLAQLEQQAAQRQPVQTPDPYEDPEGFAAFQQAQVGSAIQNITLNTSERFARKEHGAETVDSAKAWALQRFAADPLYQTQVLNDADPYERVVSDWRKEQMLSEVSDPKEFEQFKAWKQAQNALAQQGGQPPPPIAAPAIPSPSLASAPSAGSILTEIAASEEDIFNEVALKR